MRSRFIKYERWLTQRHPYRNVIKKLEPRKVKNPLIDGKLLAEYISASIPLHAADGWGYLGRAFDSIRIGDLNTAVHLAYYAELRAAMSLLACEGVGVFNRRHVAIGPGCTPTMWKSRISGTHYATWKLLESWAKDRLRVTSLLTAIEVESRTIDEWFDAARISQISRTSVAQDWLNGWGIDLKYFERDHRYRNHISYRPSKIHPDDYREVNPYEDIIEPIFQIWDALEPSADRGGAAIDRVLLQKALTKAHDDYLSPTETWEDFLLRLDDVASSTFQEQLTNLRKNGHYVFLWAGDASRFPPLQAVVARATLLLRVASAVCARRLSNAGVTKQELQFWWTRLGEDGGLWSDDADLNSLSDLLWPDVVLALDICESELDQLNSSGTVYDIGQILWPQVALTQFNRVPFWLLGID